MLSNSIRVWHVRIQPNGLFGGLNCPFILARTESRPPRHNAQGDGIARIRLRPRFQSLHLPLQVPGYLPVVENQDKEPLAIADAFA